MSKGSYFALDEDVREKRKKFFFKVLKSRSLLSSFLDECYKARKRRKKEDYSYLELLNVLPIESRWDTAYYLKWYLSGISPTDFIMDPNRSFSVYGTEREREFREAFTHYVRCVEKKEWNTRNS